METTKQKFLIIRHAESEFNFALGDPSIYYDKKFIDCKITKNGESQISTKKQTFSSYPISLVLVSPLKRALQTAKGLFGDHPNKPCFLVVPFLREIVDASCDLSDFIDKPLKGFEEFDWSLMIKLADEYKGKYWLTEELGDVPDIEEIRKIGDVEQQKLEILRKMKEYFQSTKKEHENKADKFESVRAFQKNTEKLMNFLDNLKENRKNSKGHPEDVVAIVAHNGLLRALRSKVGMDTDYMVNCEMREFLY